MATPSFDEQVERGAEAINRGDQQAESDVKVHIRAKKTSTTTGEVENEELTDEVTQQNPKSAPRPAEETESIESEEVEVPFVIGMRPDEAKNQLLAVGLDAFESVSAVANLDGPLVVGSSPEPGSVVGLGQTITLMVEVPDEEDEDEDKDENEDEDDEDNEEPEEEEGETEPEDEAESDGLGEATEDVGEAGAELAGEGAAAEGAIAAGAAEGVAGEAGLAAGGAAAEAGAGLLAATSEFWVPALAIIAGIVVVLALGVFILVTMISYCNQGGASGFFTRTASTVGSWVGVIPVNICKELAVSPSAQNFGSSGGQSGGAGASSSFTPNPTPTTGNDAASRALLAQYGITVNKADCTDPSQTNCTSLDNTLPATIQEIISVTKACDIASGGTGTTNKCGVQVTGGSEAGHEAGTGTCSHPTGQKMDVSASPALTTYIDNNFTPVGTRGGSGAGSQYSDPSITSSFVLESSPAHWDISVGCVG